MNYLFSKYSPFHNQSASAQSAESALDSSKETEPDSTTSSTNPTSSWTKSQLNKNNQLESTEHSSNPAITTPVSYNPHKKLAFEKTNTTTTEILSLPITQNSTASSGLAITNSGHSKTQMFTPVTVSNSVGHNNNDTNNFVLPVLNNELNSARSYTQTPTLFNSNSNMHMQEDSGKSSNSVNKTSSSSLMNQNGSNMRNKLTDFADILSKLKSSDINSSNNNVDFKAEPSSVPTKQLNDRPKQLGFQNFKKYPTNSETKSGDETAAPFMIPSKMLPSANKLKLEQGNADKYKEILKNAGYLLINRQRIKTSMDDLTSICELGSGTCGQVYKMVHNPTGYVMAVKQMGITGVAEENKRIIMDLDVVLKSHDCADIVKCLGYFISDSDVWICMELMSMCFDKLLKLIKQPIPEDILCKMSVSTLNALNYLKQTHNVIHRDIKPSNILINENGQIKLCDFGISGNLINSNAKSRNNTGCAGYMAPERIDPPDRTNPVYDIRADVWSLGLTLVELATGEYPYKKCKNEFEVMSTILYQDAPTNKLETGQFSKNFKSFVNKCLAKDVNKRPKYNILLQDPLILQYKDPEMEVDVKAWFQRVLAESNRGDLTPVSSLLNLSIENQCESTSTTPTATSNSIVSMNST